MLNQFVQQKDAIVATLALINPTLLSLSLEMLREACKALKPFEEITVEINAEWYVNIQNIFYELQIYTHTFSAFIIVTFIIISVF